MKNYTSERYSLIVMKSRAISFKASSYPTLMLNFLELQSLKLCQIEALICHLISWLMQYVIRDQSSNTLLITFFAFFILIFLLQKQTQKQLFLDDIVIENAVSLEKLFLNSMPLLRVSPELFIIQVQVGVLLVTYVYTASSYVYGRFRCLCLYCKFLCLYCRFRCLCLYCRFRMGYLLRLLLLTFACFLPNVQPADDCQDKVTDCKTANTGDGGFDLLRGCRFNINEVKDNCPFTCGECPGNYFLIIMLNYIYCGM